jgi:hypothetical protein
MHPHWYRHPLQGADGVERLLDRRTAPLVMLARLERPLPQMRGRTWLYQGARLRASPMALFHPALALSVLRRSFVPSLPARRRRTRRT